MPTIKDALDIIGKLTVAEQEKALKQCFLSPAFVKSLNIEDFVAKETLCKWFVYALFVAVSMWFAMVIVKMAHSDMYVRIVASPS